MIARGLACLAFASAVLSCVVTTAADLPPDLVSRFTRQVQPLIVNRCAAGACHGGPAGHEPRFERGPASARPDRTHTLANIHTFLDTVGTDRDPKRLVTLLAGTHPATPARGGYTAAPLTASERITIESWLAAVRQAESGRRVDHAVRQASAQVAAAPRPNRFRDLLETAANPPALEEPPQPQGVIFKNDDGSATEPPVAPEPPADTATP
jgi:hypothetical protein